MLVRVLMSYSTRVMQPMEVKTKTTIKATKTTITISYLSTTIKLRTSQHHPLPSQLATISLPTLPPIPPPIFALRYLSQTTTSLHYHPQPLPKVTPPPLPPSRRCARVNHGNGHIRILLLLPHEGESLG